MKILFLSSASNIHTVRWVNALALSGVEVHLAYNSNHKPYIDGINENIIQHPMKYGGKAAYYFNRNELIVLCKKISPDLVNAHYASGYGTLARLAKVKPLFLSVWGSDVYLYPYINIFNMKTIKKNLLYANRIGSTSNVMANQIRKLVSENTLDIGITPFGVDTSVFKSKKNKKDDNPIIIGTIKTLSIKYGISDLIKAIRIVLDNFNENKKFRIVEKIEVHIYGEGDQKENLIKLTNDLNLSEVVFFKGRVPNKEVPEILREFDIFCVTSLSESFGVAAVEAMAASLPVVATDADGLTEVVVDNITGLVVKKNNPSEVAEAIEKLILDIELRNYLGENGRKRVVELYEWEKNVETMIDNYKITIDKYKKYE